MSQPILKWKCGRCGHEVRGRPSRWKHDGPKRCGKCWSRGEMEPMLLGMRVKVDPSIPLGTMFRLEKDIASPKEVKK